VTPAGMSPSMEGATRSSRQAARETQPLAGLAGTIELGGEVSVNRLGFGSMRVPGSRGEPSPQEANRILRRAIELGVNFFDTAHAYGRSEQLIGDGLPLFLGTDVAPEDAVYRWWCPATDPRRVVRIERAAARGSAVS
jgi:hypothetical protein